ncbi:MAG: chitobiase/beta-hexosaminidase C-terminal domain-containing protein, partial [Planctomycetota bacterium]
MNSIGRCTLVLSVVLLAVLASCSEENTYVTAEDKVAPVTTAIPPGGAYLYKQNVVLVATEAATIYYTTDGSDPTTASAVYAGPIPVYADLTLKFFGVDGSGNTEVIRTQVYAFPFVIRLWGGPQNVSNTSVLSYWPEIAVDSTNVPHISWIENVSSAYNTATASGPSFSPWVNVSNVTLPTQTDLTAIAIDANGVVHIVWRERIGGTNWEIIYANSTNWSTTRVNLSNTPDFTSFPSAAVDGAGVIHVVWEQTLPGPNREIMYANSTNWTTTLVNITNTSDNSNTPRIAVDSNNNAHVVWREDTALGINEIYYADSTNWGATQMNVSNTTDNSFDPRIALDANDDVHAAWMESTGAGVNPEIFYAKSTNWALTQVNISNTTDPSTAPALGLDAAGTPHVA